MLTCRNVPSCPQLLLFILYCYKMTQYMFRVMVWFGVGACSGCEFVVAVVTAIVVVVVVYILCGYTHRPSRFMASNIRYVLASVECIPVREISRFSLPVNPSDTRRSVLIAVQVAVTTVVEPPTTLHRSRTVQVARVIGVTRTARYKIPI